MNHEAHVKALPEIYGRLMASDSAADPRDRHVLACIIAAAREDEAVPVLQGLGLDRAALGRLLDAVFPGAVALDELAAPDSSPGEDAIEEPDYRDLLLGGRAAGAEMEEWLAHMVARRSLQPEHLWVSLGLTTRQELSDMLHRHFPGVAAKNTRHMRWKKFFYREMCQAEGVFVCKSPICDVCPDFSHCYGAEE